eukprot:scaffold6362_cov123-Isochrysis_galbana.AAC.10
MLRLLLTALLVDVQALQAEMSLPCARAIGAAYRHRCATQVARMPEDSDDEKPLPSGRVDWDKEMGVLQRELFMLRAEAAYASAGRPGALQGRAALDWQWYAAAIVGIVGACFIEQVSQQAMVA